MAYNFDKALKQGGTEQQIRSYLAPLGREAEADAYFGKKNTSGYWGQVLDQVHQSTKDFFDESGNAAARFLNQVDPSLQTKIDPELQKRLEEKGGGKLEALKSDIISSGGGKPIDETSTTPGQKAVQTQLQITGAGVKGLFGVVTAPLIPIIKKTLEVTMPILQKLPDSTPIPSSLTAGTFYTVGQLKAAYNSQAIQKGLFILRNQIDAYGPWAKNNPDSAADLSAIFNIAQLLPVEKVVGIGAVAGKEALIAGKEALIAGKEALGTIAKKTIAPIAEKAAPIIESRLATNVANVEAGGTAKMLLEKAPEQVRTLVGQGIDIAEANRLAALNPHEQELAKEMLDIFKAGNRGPISEPPATVLGKSVQAPIQYLSNLQAEVAPQLDKAYKLIKDVKPTDTIQNVSNALQGTKGLEEIKFIPSRVVNGEKIPASFNFANTILENNLSAQKSINDYLATLEAKTVGQLRTKRAEIFADIGGKSKAGIDFTNDAKRAMQAMRSGLLTTIDEMAPTKIRELSTKYARIEEGLSTANTKFKDVLGSTPDILNLRAGELASRLTGKASADMTSFVSELEGLASEMGWQKLTDSKKLQEIHTIFDKYFGQQARTALKDEFGKALQQTAKGKIPTTLADIAGMIVEHTPIIKNFIQSSESKQKAIENFLKEALNKP